MRSVRTMEQAHPPVSLPRHVSLCLAVGSDNDDADDDSCWECVQGELSELSHEGACIVLDADLGPTRASHGHLSLEDDQGHFGHQRRVRVLWHRRDMGHSCLGLGFTS